MRVVEPAFSQASAEGRAACEITVLCPVVAPLAVGQGGEDAHGGAAPRCCTRPGWSSACPPPRSVWSFRTRFCSFLPGRLSL